MYINILDMYINVYINIFLMGGGWDKYKKSVYIELDLDNAISVYSHQQNTCNFFQIYRIKPK